MYTDHPHFYAVSDDTKVWKYLDLFKYLDILTTCRLFLLRSDKFADTQDSLGPDRQYISERFKKDTGRDASEEIVSTYENLYNFARKSSYVNCWHINQVESSVMWDAYSNLNGGVLIESTFGRLKESIKHPEEIHISKVIYGQDIPLGNVMFPLIHKRQQFQDERELRIFLTSDLNKFKDPKFLGALPEFKKIEVDRGILIKNALFHPLTPDWVVDSISGVIAQYGEQFVPVKSSLYS